MKIGVLSLQGNFKEHIDVLKKLNVNVIEVRENKHLNNLDGLIIPGGESTTIMKLINDYKLNLSNIPIFGTCAGCIIMSKLNLIDIEVQRNAYGSQLDSFITELNCNLNNNICKINGVFIRAPKIIKVGKDVEILAKYNNEIVLVRQNKNLASTFHPELNNEISVHKLFLNIIKNE
jgi:pyridoxal 5'-phosphate synthase pdxT subunit